MTRDASAVRCAYGVPNPIESAFARFRYTDVVPTGCGPVGSGRNGVRPGASGAPPVAAEVPMPPIITDQPLPRHPESPGADPHRKPVTCHRSAISGYVAHPCRWSNSRLAETVRETPRAGPSIKLAAPPEAGHYRGEAS